MPPSRARAIASSYSVTVSIAALTIGMLSGMRREKRVAVSTSRGWTSEYCGTSRTSSKVSASGPILPSARMGSKGAIRSTFSSHRARPLTPSPSGKGGGGPPPSLLSRALRQLLRLRLEPRLEIVVAPDAEGQRSNRAVPARGELIVSLGKSVVLRQRGLDAGVGERFEEALHPHLGAEPQVETAMELEAAR